MASTQPIRGQQNVSPSFPWPGPDHSSQTTDLFWSQETANHDNILSLTLIICDCLELWLLSLCCVWVTVSITLGNGVIIEICGHITQTILLFSQRRRDFFSSIKILSELNWICSEFFKLKKYLLIYMLCSPEIWLFSLLRFSISHYVLGKWQLSNLWES